MAHQIEYGFQLGQRVWFLHGDTLKYGTIEVVSASQMDNDPAYITYAIQTSSEMCEKIGQMNLSDADIPTHLLNKLRFRYEGT